MGFTNWQERAEKAEEALRSLASFVGAGGYNADKVDADVFEQKIRWGIGQIMERMEKAEAELESLRWQKPVATLILSYDGADFEMYYDNNKLRFEGMSMKLYAAAGAAPAVPAPVQTAKQADCRTCANSGKANGLSQETYCESCVHEGRNWRKNNFLDAAGQRLLEGGK